MRPLIGVSSDYRDGKCTTWHTYSKAVEAASGVPVVLPPVDRDVLRETLVRLGGVLITGGPDVPPGRYGQEKSPATECVTPERDAFDFLLIEELKALDKPTLAICYGAQVLNVAFGGTLFQDIPTLLAGALKHHRRQAEERPTHVVTVRRGSLLHRVLGVDRLLTNSSHHQAIRETPAPLRQVAFSEDDVVEAVESTRHRFLLGVQWHPEAMIDQTLHLKLFQALVTEASQ
jgi:putative glutamine amidotransferase